MVTKTYFPSQIWLWIQCSSTGTIVLNELRKLPPKVASYRDNKTFENSKILSKLRSVFSYHGNQNLETNPDVFFRICKDVLDKHAPRKKKYMCGNSKNFMTKALSKDMI